MGSAWIYVASSLHSANMYLFPLVGGTGHNHVWSVFICPVIIIQHTYAWCGRFSSFVGGVGIAVPALLTNSYLDHGRY